MSGVIEALIGDKVVEWFREDELPELHGALVWVQCGVRNEDDESPYCSVELPRVGELSELSTLLMAVGIMTIRDEVLAFAIAVDHVVELQLRHRDLLLLLLTLHPTVSEVFSAIVFHAHGSSNN